MNLRQSILQSGLILAVLSTAVNALAVRPGTYIPAGDRVCVNGAIIEDSGFTSTVTEYTFLVSADHLTISMKFKGNPVVMEYSLGELIDGKTQVNPITEGSNTFQLEQNGSQITALFTDHSSKFCGGDQIAALMKIK